MPEIPITERFLMDTGGWQSMKHAKALVTMGRVISFNYTAPILRGLVREGETEYRAGLKIKSATDVENICSCRDSREWGMICAHSLALGWAVIQSKIPAPKATARPDATNQREPNLGPQLVLEGTDVAIELQVVLAPNLESTWEKNQMMVGFEVVANGNRLLASALDPKRAYRCHEADRRVLELGREIAGGKLPGMTILSRDQFLNVIEALRGHPRVTLGRKQAVIIASEPILPKLSTFELPDGRWKIFTDPLPADKKLLAGGEQAWIWGPVLGSSNASPRFQPVSPGLPIGYLSVLSEPVILSPEQGISFVQRELPELKKYFQIDSIGPKGLIGAGIPEVHATIEGSLNHLGAKLQCLYGKRMVTLGVTSWTEAFIYQMGDSQGTRNVAFERGCLERLLSSGFSGPSVTGEYTLKGQNAILTFFVRDLPRLQRDWNVSVGSRFKNITGEIERITPKLEITGSGENWFDFSFSLEAQGGDRFAAGEVQRLLQMGQNFTRLKDGRIAVFDPAGLEEFENILRDCDLSQLQPGKYRIPRPQAGYLDGAFRELDGASLVAPQDWAQWTGSQRQLTPLEPVDLGPLASVLRPYQKEGVYWLHFLSRNGLGGILADEMGLGKTVQMLAFLKTLKGPSLVVCPSSLLFNWAREAAKFVPDTKVLTIEGPNRSHLFAQIPRNDLILTSYPLLRRDAPLYRGIEFAGVVLDEATHIKNPDTQNAQAALSLRGRNRFVLTGTPIENSVRDLWSLLQFVIPGYLGGRDDFRERYELPIGRGSEPERRRLAKRLRPVMLRRLKRDVVKELPEKIEQVAYCDLSEEQRELYQKLHQEGRRKIEELAEEKNQGKARMVMLTALLRLRQVCCDLRLLGQTVERPSAKSELLSELLEEAIDGGHRVLVFSQFVSMLHLLQEQLRESGTPFCYLDGQTKERGAEVDRFQQSSEFPVFLISLKAGGVGLNLPAADTVVHFDPWWNPAVEAQATDRAHRIGQTRVVTSYKLIARGTVEEKILNLQQKKRELIDAMVESDEPLMTGLTMGEIQELLK
jgi:superfamily II DNA or RNA helicase